MSDSRDEDVCVRKPFGSTAPIGRCRMPRVSRATPHCNARARAFPAQSFPAQSFPARGASGFRTSANSLWTWLWARRFRWWLPAPARRHLPGGIALPACGARHLGADTHGCGCRGAFDKVERRQHEVSSSTG
jgi:hypothetical protein